MILTKGSDSTIRIYDNGSIILEYKFIKFNKNSINDIKWDAVNVYKLYECKHIAIFSHNSTWNIFDKADINNDFLLKILDIIPTSKLDHNYIYNFIYLQNSQYSIIKYDNTINNLSKNNSPTQNRKLSMGLMLFRKTNLNDNTNIINISDFDYDDLNMIKNEIFKNRESLDNTLRIISARDEEIKKITLRGYIIEYNGSWIKLETAIYKKLKVVIKGVSHFSNIYAAYLKLFKDNLFTFYSHFYTKNPVIIVNILSNSLKALSNEVLSLYFITRGRQNPELYESLSYVYKQTLFNIHGKYIEAKTNSYQSVNKTVNYYTVHSYLKDLEISLLICMIRDRPIEINSLYMTYNEDLALLQSYLNKN